MIDIENITIAYGSQVVVRGFSMSISAGEKVVLAGASGSGKSSILRSLLGFVVPDAGQISVDSCLLDEKTVWSLRRRVAYVGQEPDLGEGSVQGVIDRCFSFKANHSLRKNVSRLGGLLEQFSLAESILAKDVSELSGGEKQRVALILALLLDRPVLLLDEISSALDRECTEATADYLRGSDKTVLLATHDETLMGAADRVVDLPDLKREGA